MRRSAYRRNPSAAEAPKQVGACRPACLHSLAIIARSCENASASPQSALLRQGAGGCPAPPLEPPEGAPGQAPRPYRRGPTSPLALRSGLWGAAAPAPRSPASAGAPPALQARPAGEKPASRPPVGAAAGRRPAPAPPATEPGRRAARACGRAHLGAEPPFARPAPPLPTPPPGKQELYGRPGAVADAAAAIRSGHARLPTSGLDASAISSNPATTLPREKCVRPMLKALADKSARAF